MLERTGRRGIVFRNPDGSDRAPCSTVPGYSGHNGDDTIAVHYHIPFPLLCCTTHCERRLMTQRRISPVIVDVKIDDGTRKKTR